MGPFKAGEGVADSSCGWGGVGEVVRRDGLLVLCAGSAVHRGICMYV